MPNDKNSLLSIFKFKRKSRKQILDEKIDTNTNIQNTSLKIAAENTKINKKIVQQNEELKNLVLENKKERKCSFKKRRGFKRKRKFFRRTNKRNAKARN